MDPDTCCETCGDIGGCQFCDPKNGGGGDYDLTQYSSDDED
jgi:hypothetical protein